MSWKQLDGNIKMKNVLVTGGAGFIGSNLVEELLDRKVNVKVIDDLSSGKIENIPKGVDFLEKDLSTISIDSLCNFIEGVDIVFHLAAKARVQPSIDDPMSFNKANVDSTLNTLFASNKCGVRRFVYSASSSCYGNTRIIPTPETAPKNPLSPYGLQKYIGEEYCKLFSEIYDIDTVSLRYFNIYGERMSHDGAYSLVLAVWKNQFEKGEPLTITNDGNQRRDFTHVDDVVSANLLAATRDDNFNGEAYNIGNGKSLSMNEVVDMIGSDRVYGEKRLEPFETCADNTKAIRDLGWEPRGSLRSFIDKNFK